ncbi:PTS sugar transporter subunit IIA [Lactiplantibacillus plantarum]|uniref:PTS sugar transporter subunit IIA n=1 Tax=Lactiplantibacillus plantarum TaxID=1590 RepID=UPI0034655A07
MNKFLIASHGELAKGIQSTVELFAGKNNAISYISAYTAADEDLSIQLTNFVSSVSASDTAIIFTDLYGGSVNQKITVMAAGKTNFHIISGFNLPVVLETVLYTGKINTDFINCVVEKGRQNLKVVDLQPATDDDVDFFD